MPLRLLIVEDSEDFCLVIAAELEKHGYPVTLLRVDAPEPMRKALTEAAWDLIIADFLVPGFGALESVKLARDLAPDLPFIVVSGNVGEEVAVAVMKAGAHDYITKANLARLVPAMERELREGESRRARRQAERALHQKEAWSKRAEEALRHSEARFRDVVESLGEGLLLSGPDDVVWYANSRMGELVGCDPSEMIERPASEFCAEPCRAQGRSRGPGEAGREESELVRKDGTSLWVEINAVPLRASQGQVIGTIRAVTDISERRQAREALRKSQASLLLAQRIGRVGSWELSLADGTMESSSETRRILEATGADAPRTWSEFTSRVREEDRAKVQEAFDQAAREGTSFRADCRASGEDGSTRYLHLQGQVVLDVLERPSQMIGTLQDITERKLLEEELRQSQKMEAVGQLAGGIAHDFNNILTVIQGYTELIGFQEGIDPQTKAYANQIAVSAERASKLTRQLLAFSRKQVMQLKTLHINELLHGMAPMLQRLLGEQSKLQLHLETDLPSVHADSGMVEQALINLVVNARDAMPKGGRLVIQTSAHQIDSDYCKNQREASPGQFVCLAVIDTGCGMDAATLSRIFEPFFTTKEIGRGTGLGLSSVYGIVKQHQGWIQVSSELGQGSVFKIFLPSTRPENVSDPKSKTKLPAAETILLAEDEAPLRQLARSVLERFGYRVLEAASGPDAVSVWKEASGQVDLLLTDLVMPGGMNGRELAMALQKEKPSLKVLYTSGYSLDFVQSDLLLREGVNFVAKPYTGKSLGDAVRLCLDRKS